MITFKLDKKRKEQKIFPTLVFVMVLLKELKQRKDFYSIEFY